MTAAKGRALFDVTDLVTLIAKGHYPTGIPRVVAECLVPLMENVPDLVPVFFSRLSRAYCKVDGWRLAARDVAYVRKFVPPAKNHLLRAQAYVGALRSGRIVPKPADTLLLLGGGWAYERRHRYLFERRVARCRTIWLCHDLIPILYPKDGVQEPAFVRWLEAAIQHGNEFICASRFVEADLRDYVGRRGADVRISVVPLAHEFRPVGGPVRPVVGSLAAGATALCVGSIVSRKNQLSLVRVWDRLRDEFGERLPTLVLAGAPIDSAALRDFLSRTEDVGGKVAFVGHVSDSELARLYENCSFTIYPSSNEGWGLPVGESLWMGKPCLSSNLTSLPEVGGSHAVYFDPRNESDMTAVLRKALHGEFSAMPPSRDQLRSWRQVGADLARLF